MSALRSSVLALAAASGAVLAFEAARRHVRAHRRLAENYPFSREGMLAELASRLDQAIDVPLPWDPSRTLRTYFSSVDDYDLGVLQSTLRRIDGAIAWRAGSIDPLAIRGFLREIYVQPLEKRAKPLVDTVVVDVGTSSPDVLHDDGQGASLDDCLSAMEADESKDHPLDVLQRDVSGLGSVLTRGGALDPRLCIHPDFSIGDRTSDGEAAGRAPQGSGRFVPASARPAYWRGLTPVDRRTGTALLSFQLFDGETLWLQLERHNLGVVRDVITEMLADPSGVVGEARA